MNKHIYSCNNSDCKDHKILCLKCSIYDKKTMSYKLINKNSFNEYISKNADNNLKNFFKLLGKDEYIEAYTIKFNDVDQDIYNELWLFDVSLINGLYHPVYVNNIHIHSNYTMWSHGFDYDDGKDNIAYSFNDLINITPSQYRTYIRNELVKVWTL